MSIVSGYYKIKTSTGKYLTLPIATGTVAARGDTGAINQQWDIQMVGNLNTGPYTFRSNGYDEHPSAYSTGGKGDAVIGKQIDMDTEWNIVKNKDGTFSIYIHNYAWIVGDEGTVELCTKDKVDTRQQFAFHAVHQ